MADHVRRFTAITHPKIYFNYLFRGTPAIWSLIIENIQKYGEQTITFLHYFMEKNSTLIAAVTAASLTASLISYSAKKVAVPVLNEEVHENIREDLEKMESMLQKLLKVQSEILLTTTSGPRLQYTDSCQSGNEENGYESSNYSLSGNQNEEDAYATSSNTKDTPPLSPHGMHDQIIQLQQNGVQNNGMDVDDDHHPNNTTKNSHISDDVISISSVASSVASSVSSVISSEGVDIVTEVASTPPRRRKSKRNREPPRKHLMTTFTPAQQQAWDKHQRKLQKLAKRQKRRKKILDIDTVTDDDVQSTAPQGVVV